jgi:pimeloyl-ACP methyl ester carboxylesterase
MNAIMQRSAAGLSYLARDGGGGTPIVLLHGIGSNAHSFAPLMQAFDARSPMLAWDAPGYGSSQPLAVAWPDASDYAAAFDRLLVHLEISSCILIGHSLGVLIAARSALVSPGRVAALFLISPALGYAAEKGGALPATVAGRIEELDRLGAEKFAAARAGGLLAHPAARPDVLQAVERAMAAVRRPGYDQAARLLAGGRLIDDVAQLEVPTAVLVGAQDRITPPANARRVFDALPASSGQHAYREIPDAGHAVCQEQPAEVARAIAEFVANRASANKANAHA